MIIDGKPTIKGPPIWEEADQAILIGAIRDMLKCYDAGECLADRIPKHENAIMEAAVTMVCGSEVWRWIREKQDSE